MGIADQVQREILYEAVDWEQIKWKSKNPLIATVENGVVTGLSEGKTTIVASFGNLSVQCSVLVNEVDMMQPPAMLKTIADEAFAGTAMEAVYLSDGVETIGSKAFADCGELALIFIPESAESIAEDAFEGCENLTICTPEGSYAQQYAEANGIAFVEAYK